MGGINSTRYVIYLHTFLKREDVTLILSLEVSEMVGKLSKFITTRMKKFLASFIDGDLRKLLKIEEKNYVLWVFWCCFYLDVKVLLSRQNNYRIFSLKSRVILP